MGRYDFKEVEVRWQDYWDENDTYATTEDPSRKKLYVLDMFPYPSGDGLHVGHPEGYTATDIISRKRRMEGWNVLHPMGWDAFGLPAENFAIKRGVHPKGITRQNIRNFRRQLRMLGFSYDWSREIDTSDPAYYRWTQWLFLFLYRKGLAYKKKAPVNWCESCRTVLANEQVLDGRCERCSHEVTQKDLEQWFFRVTDYADRLLEGLDGLDWPERIKLMQQNWIGRSEGVEIVFRGEDADGGFDVPVFTTRPDTLFGVTYVVLAPEHPAVSRLTAADRREEVEGYLRAARTKTDLQRTGLEQEKTGVPLGSTLVHPLSGEPVPVWTADYVLGSYGTGAVMGVPAHDERDYSFAQRYGLPISFVIRPEDEAVAGFTEGAAYTGAGILSGSGEFDGLGSEEAKDRIAAALVDCSLGERKINYHLRDWLISRQRYWGAPIPIVYCDRCGEQPVPEEQLPVLLPDDVDFRPTGESPLARSEDFHRATCPECGQAARRESDTMDTFVDSSWYFLRFTSPHEGERPFSDHAVNYWCPVDVYVGGAEHAVLHLLYARFFTKVLCDHGLLPFEEPFLRLRNPGLILGENGEKMSKSKGNVINPDDVVDRYGADVMRLYEMFMGDFEDAKPWDTRGIVGLRRFLDRVWTTVHDTVHERRETVSPELERLLHRTVKKVTEDIEDFKFNTAISALMILLNEWTRVGGGDRGLLSVYLRLLAPFAPHLAEELWRLIGHESSIFQADWPAWDETLAAEEEVEVVVQVNGKVRDRFLAPAGTDEDELKRRARESDKVKNALQGGKIKKVIVVRGRLVSIVASRD